MRKNQMAKLTEAMTEKVAKRMGIDQDSARSFIGAYLIQNSDQIVDACLPAPRAVDAPRIAESTGRVTEVA